VGTARQQFTLYRLVFAWEQRNAGANLRAPLGGRFDDGMIRAMVRALWTGLAPKKQRTR